MSKTPGAEIAIPPQILPISSPDHRLPSQVDDSTAIIKNAVAYTGSNMISQIANVISGFVMRRILVPEMMGIWNLVGMLRGYLQQISVGILGGAAMDLPRLRGARQHEKETLYRSVAFTYSLCEIFFLAACLWGYTAWKGHHLRRYEGIALLATGILGITARLQESYVTFFRAAQFYVPLSQALLFTNAIDATLMPLGAFFAGIPGLLGAAVFTEALQSAVLAWKAKKSGLTSHFTWDTASWKHLSFLGLAYRITDYPNTFFSQFDLLWVATFVGMKGLGIYTFAKAFALIAQDVTVRLGSVVYTRALTQYGENVPAAKIGHDMRRFVKFQLMVCVPLVGWLVVAGCPFFIRQLVPMYRESIPLATTLILILFFAIQNTNLCVTWIAEKRFIPYGISNGFGALAVMGSIAGTWFLLGRHDLQSIAWSMLAGYGFYFTYMMFSAGREFWGIASSARLYGQVLFAFTWAWAVFTFFIYHQNPNLAWPSDLLQSFISALGMLICLIPLLVFGIWSSKGWTYIQQMLRHVSRMRI